MEYQLTTEHPSSSYNIPVLLIEGVAYGAMDKLPNGEIAFYFVQKLDDPHKLKFLKSAPDLYFRTNHA